MKIIFVFFVVLLFVVLIFLGMNQVKDKSSQAVGMVTFDKEYELTYSGGECSPEKLEIPFGTMARIKVTSDETILFEIPDYYVKEAVSPKVPAQIVFSPYGPGEYTFICDNGGSEGTIVVT